VVWGGKLFVRSENELIAFDLLPPVPRRKGLGPLDWPYRQA
jgi:hypothetical protein